jgi:hypothetical protein
MRPSGEAERAETIPRRDRRQAETRRDAFKLAAFDSRSTRSATVETK